MYNLAHFTEEDETLVFDFMQKNYFVSIVGYDGDYPVATHVPVDVKKEDGKIILTGHIMKHTSHHKAFVQNENVLVIFNGPHCYVSASWYVKKDVASTWNYIDVQARGKIKFYDTEQTKQIIHNLTDQHESADSEAAFNKLPIEYVDRLVKAIIGFTIEISSIENVFKLSQNRDIQSRENIIEKLSASNDAGANEIALEMKKRLSE
jgi:transcriptional regulator